MSSSGRWWSHGRGGEGSIKTIKSAFYLHLVCLCQTNRLECIKRALAAYFSHLESFLDPLAERRHLAGELLEVVVRRRDRLLEPARRRRHEVEPVLQTSAVALQLVQLRNGDDVTSGRRDLRDDVQRLLHSPRLLVQLRLDSLKFDKQASGLKLFCST